VRRWAILPTLIAAVAVVAGCGGSSHPRVNPEAMLDAAARHPISSAQVEVDLSLQVSGVPQLSSPVRLKLQGPYVSGGGTRIPSFDWRLNATALGFPVGGRLVSTGSNAYLSIYGDDYEVGTDAVAAANRRIRETAASTGGPLSLHPRTWFGPARIDGSGNEGGADCERITAPLRGQAMTRDLAPLGTNLGISEPLSIAGRVRACVGYDDRVMHELVVDAVAGVPEADRGRLAGASVINFTLDVTASDVGQPQQISAPGGGARPIRDLALTLNDLGVSIP
jgi:hypothetical protein